MPQNDNGEIKAAMLKELVKCLEGSCVIDNFSMDEIEILITLISTY
jgi:hypothetical protein